MADENSVDQANKDIVEVLEKLRDSFDDRFAKLTKELDDLNRKLKEDIENQLAELKPEKNNL